MRRFSLWPCLFLLLSGCIHNPVAEPKDAVLEPVEALEVDNGIRVHQLQVDRDRLMAITEPGRITGFLRLPDDRLLDFDVLELEGEPPRVWRGRLHAQDQAGGSLTLSRSGERLSAHFRWEGIRYEVSTKNATHLLKRHGPHEGPDHGDPLIPDRDASDHAR